MRPDFFTIEKYNVRGWLYNSIIRKGSQMEFGKLVALVEKTWEMETALAERTLAKLFYTLATDAQVKRVEEAINDVVKNRKGN
jgi:hypothetical protein